MVVRHASVGFRRDNSANHELELEERQVFAVRRKSCATFTELEVWHCEGLWM